MASLDPGKGLAVWTGPWDAIVEFGVRVCVQRSIFRRACLELGIILYGFYLCALQAWSASTRFRMSLSVSKEAFSEAVSAEAQLQSIGLLNSTLLYLVF